MVPGEGEKFPDDRGPVPGGEVRGAGGISDFGRHFPGDVGLKAGQETRVGDEAASPQNADLAFHCCSEVAIAATPAPDAQPGGLLFVA